MSDKHLDFKRIVDRYALAPDRAGADMSIRADLPDEKTGGRRVFAALRYRGVWGGAARRTPEQLKDIADRYTAQNRNEAVDKKVSSEEWSVLLENEGAKTVHTALLNYLGNDLPLARRVLQDYANLYGRDLTTATHVSRADLYRLDKTVERVRKSARDQRAGVIVVNPKIEATKRTVQIITDKFKAAQTKHPQYEEKLQELKNLQEKLDKIGPRANPDEVDAMAEKAIEKMDLAKRRFGFAWVTSGVKANFRSTLQLARETLDRELGGEPTLPEQQHLRFATNHVVAQLLGHRALIEEKIKDLSETIERNTRSVRRGAGGEDDMRRMDPTDVKNLAREMKTLKAADAAIGKALPHLAKLRNNLTHLRSRPDMDYENAQSEFNRHLQAVDTELQKHADVLRKHDIEHGVPVDAPDDGMHLGLMEPDPREAIGNRPNRARSASDAMAVVSYADAFTRLLDDDDEDPLASSMERRHSIAERLADSTKDRVWLWTPMSESRAKPGQEKLGLYRSVRVQNAELQRNAHDYADWEPGPDDTPQILREMKKHAEVNDGADPYRRRILRAGGEHRLELLRRFNAEAAKVGHGDDQGDDEVHGGDNRNGDQHHGSWHRIARALLEDVVTKRFNRMKVDDAERFFRRNVWPKEMLDKVPFQHSTAENKEFLQAHRDLQASAEVAKSAVRSGIKLQPNQIYEMREAAEKVKVYLEKDEVFNAGLENADEYIERLNDIVGFAAYMGEPQEDEVE